MRQNEQQNAAHEPHRIQRELEMTLAVILKFRLGGQGKLYVSSSLIVLKFAPFHLVPLALLLDLQNWFSIYPVLIGSV